MASLGRLLASRRKPAEEMEFEQELEDEPIVDEPAYQAPVYVAKQPRQEKSENIVHNTSTPGTERTAESSPTETTLDATINMKNATIDTHQDVVVHGRLLDSTVRCRRLTLHPTAEVTGDIQAEEIRTHGTLEGTIHASQFFSYKGSLTKGDLTCGTLASQPGSSFDGRVRAEMTSSEAVPATVSRGRIVTPAAASMDLDFMLERRENSSIKVLRTGS